MARDTNTPVSELDLLGVTKLLLIAYEHLAERAGLVHIDKLAQEQLSARAREVIAEAERES